MELSRSLSRITSSRPLARDKLSPLLEACGGLTICAMVSKASPTPFLLGNLIAQSRLRLT